MLCTFNQGDLTFISTFFSPLVILPIHSEIADISLFIFIIEKLMKTNLLIKVKSAIENLYIRSYAQILRFHSLE